MTVPWAITSSPALEADAPSKWYRYEEKHWAAPTDEYGDPIRGGGSTTLELIEFNVVRFTPKGAWISHPWLFEPSYREDGSYKAPGKRFQLRICRKRFACPTKKEALESLIARKTRQISIWQAQINQKEKAIQAANRLLGKPEFES